MRGLTEPETICMCAAKELAKKGALITGDNVKMATNARLTMTASNSILMSLATLGLLIANGDGTFSLMPPGIAWPADIDAEVIP